MWFLLSRHRDLGPYVEHDVELRGATHCGANDDWPVAARPRSWRSFRHDRDNDARNNCPVIGHSTGQWLRGLDPAVG